MRRGTRQPGRHGFTMVEMPFDRSTSPFDKLAVPSVVEGLAAARRGPPSRAMSASNRELRVVRQMPRRVVRKWKGGAFTLIELLVVIAMVGMLSAILSVALMAARRTSIRLECQSKLNQMGQIVQQLSLDNAGIYPMLEVQAPLTKPLERIPWWARVYQLSQGASIGIGATPSGETEIRLPEQLPPSLQMFHCRMAPALDNSGATPEARLANLNASLSYGLNYDVKSDGHAYECSAGTNTLAVGPSGDPAAFSYTEIKSPSEFILIAEGNGYAIAAQKVSEARNETLKPIVSRHGSEANVLFADQHVELRRAATVEAGDIETHDINLDTRLWTLPAD